MRILLTEFKPTDIPEMFSLFYNTVHSINIIDYTPQQIVAWAPKEKEKNRWIARMPNQRTFCAWIEIEKEQESSKNKGISKDLVGFTSLTEKGHLDMMFVNHNHQGEGIATILLTRVLYEAKLLGYSKVDTSASITGRPFFEKKGFKFLHIQEKKLRGQIFMINIMELTL